MPVLPRPALLAYVALGGLTTLNALAPGSAPEGTRTASAAAVRLPVDFAVPGTLEVSRTEGTAAVTTVLIRNDYTKPVQVAFSPVLYDSDGEVLTAGIASSDTIEAGRTKPVKLALTLTPPLNGLWDRRLPARGTLMLIAKDSADSTETVRVRDLTLVQIQPALAELITSTIGLPAALSLLLYGLVRSGSARTPATTDAPDWTPQSWSSNLAIGGALLTTVLGISMLPAQTHYMARSSYSVLSVFFAALIALAPAVYGLMKAGSRPDAPEALRLFAFAAAITVWATISQLGAAALVFLELVSARAISSPSGWVAAAILGIVAANVVIYAFRAVTGYLNPSAGARAPAVAAARRDWTLL